MGSSTSINTSIEANIPSMDPETQHPEEVLVRISDDKTREVFMSYGDLMKMSNEDRAKIEFLALDHFCPNDIVGTMNHLMYLEAKDRIASAERRDTPFDEETKRCLILNTQLGIYPHPGMSESYDEFHDRVNKKHTVYMDFLNIYQYEYPKDHVVEPAKLFIMVMKMIRGIPRYQELFQILKDRVLQSAYCCFDQQKKAVESLTFN